MKRFICVIGIIIMMVCMVSPLAVKADGVTLSIEDFIGLNTVDKMTLYELTMALEEGAELSWADLDLGDALLSNEEKARRMLAYYKYKAMGLVSEGAVSTIEFLFDSDIDKDHETAAITFQASSGINSEVKNSILDGVINQYYNNNADVVAPINLNTIAFWNRYGTSYINKYVKNMNAVENNVDDSIPVTPEMSPYLSYMENVGSLFLTYNGISYDITNPSYLYYLGSFEPFASREFNFINPSVVAMQTNLNNFIGDHASQVYYYPDLSVNIYLDENVNKYRISVSSDEGLLPYVTFQGGGRGELYGTDINYFGAVSVKNINGVSCLCWEKPFNSAVSNSFASFHALAFSDMNAVFAFLEKNFRNINISVEGEMWQRKTTGVNISGNISVTIPDAVIDSSNEDGKIVNVPIALPYDPATDEIISSNVNLDKVFDAIADKIAQGATSIKWADLVDAGAIEGTDGIPLTDTDFKLLPLISILTKTRVTPQTIAIDDVIPSLPTLPSLGIGENPAFDGITVLARIINVTNQSLPEELVMCFYGVVFGIVILGIIKIMHK